MDYSLLSGPALAHLKALPTRSVDLVLTSPPYEDARTYGIDFRLKGQAWVDWLIPHVVEACRVCRSLVFVVMAGKSANHRYTPVVEWLVADLTRQHGVVCGPAPYCFFRFGVPGSGHRRYHRRDWEPVYGFCFADRLPIPWADNTALGHAPRWAPGGACTNRMTNGQRQNRDEWGGTGASTDPVRPDRERKGEGRRPRKRPAAAGGGESTYRKRRIAGGRGDKITGGGTLNGLEHDAEGNLVPKLYTPPKLANPGNVVREHYDAEAVRELLFGEGKIDLGDVVRCKVGKHQMGSALCHENEAPFAERLAEFFVRSYCPPGGVVLDPFCGSGTTLVAALAFGRRAIGIDLRAEQALLTEQRIQEYLREQAPGAGG